MIKLLLYVFVAFLSISTFALEVKVIDGSRVEYTCRVDNSVASIKSKESWFCLIVNKNTNLVKSAIAPNAFSEFSKLTKDYFLSMPEQTKEIVSFHDLLDKVMNSKLMYLDMNSLVRYYSGVQLEITKNKLRTLCSQSVNPTIVFENVNGEIFASFLICSNEVYILENSQTSSVDSNDRYFIENSISEIWTDDYRPFLKIQCSVRDANICSSVCKLDNAGLCQVPVKLCRDCIGTSLLVTDIFEGMGVRYKNTGKEIRFDEFVEFLRLGQFVTFSAKSVYNHVDNYDSLNLQMRFNGLCPFEPKNPAIVFFDLRPKSNVLNKVRYVACDQSIFEMDDKALIDNDGQLKKFKKQFIFTAF